MQKLQALIFLMVLMLSHDCSAQVVDAEVKSGVVASVPSDTANGVSRTSIQGNTLDGSSHGLMVANIGGGGGKIDSLSGITYQASQSSVAHQRLKMLLVAMPKITLQMLHDDRGGSNKVNVGRREITDNPRQEAMKGLGNMDEFGNMSTNLVSTSSSLGNFQSSSDTGSKFGSFPDSTRGLVDVSPPLGGENLFRFSPQISGFRINFDVRHLNPNYSLIAVKGIQNDGGQNAGSFSSFNPDNIQQNVPAKGPSTSPVDPIAGALQAMLHPDQQGQSQ
jgi:hypothetical protein